MSFFEEIAKRGFISQLTDEKEIKRLFERKRVSAYIGFDATADSLHVGSLLQIMVLRWLQHYGHRPIVIMGGATTKIGDPSGKDKARAMLGNEDIYANIEKIQKIFSRYISLDRTDPNSGLLFNNDEWFSGLEYIAFLKNVGSHFSVNRMLTFDSVKSRLARDQHLSFIEFNYLILQAYDFMFLHSNYDCDLQIGGSDQWGNIISGIELIGKSKKGPAFGLTTPLITTSSGRKMGKTEDGAVWLDENKTSVFDFWQFWRNTDDADVGRFIRLYTIIPLEEIEEIEKGDINNAKTILATSVTSLCHGEDKTRKTVEQARAIFERSAPLPEIIIKESSSMAVFLSDIIFRAKLAGSKSKARQLIRGGAVRINGDKVDNEETKIEPVILEKGFEISVGKKQHYRVRYQ